MFSFRKSMLATNYFSKSVQNAHQNFIRSEFSPDRTGINKNTITFLPLKLNV